MLATPKGEPTWKRGEQESVIDLTFISPDLYRKVNFCGTVEEWALTRDHIPIRIQINDAGCPPAERRRLALRKLNTQSFLQCIQELNWATSEDPFYAL